MRFHCPHLKITNYLPLSNLFPCSPFLHPSHPLKLWRMNALITHSAGLINQQHFGEQTRKKCNPCLALEHTLLLLTFLFPDFSCPFCCDERSARDLWLPLIISEDVLEKNGCGNFCFHQGRRGKGCYLLLRWEVGLKQSTLRRKNYSSMMPFQGEGVQLKLKLGQTAYQMLMKKQISFPLRNKDKRCDSSL